MLSIFLQATNVVADSTGIQEGQEPLSVLDFAFKGGVMLIPIVVLSVIAIYIVVERYLTIKKAREFDSMFMSRLKELVTNGDIKSAETLCQTTNTPIAKMLEKGLTRIGKPLRDIQVAVENVGNLEVSKLEKGMPILATISGAAPMLGFLGTVTGMIKTFYTLSQNGDGIDAGSLSGGIYEAMVTTVGGLIVGIIAYISYNLLTAMIDKVIYRMETTSMEFLDILHEPAS